MNPVAHGLVREVRRRRLHLMNRVIEQCYLLGVAPNAIERRDHDAEALQLILRRQSLGLCFEQVHRDVP